MHRNTLRIRVGVGVDEVASRAWGVSNESIINAWVLFDVQNKVTVTIAKIFVWMVQKDIRLLQFYVYKCSICNSCGRCELNLDYTKERMKSMDDNLTAQWCFQVELMERHANRCFRTLVASTNGIRRQLPPLLTRCAAVTEAILRHAVFSQQTDVV